MSGRGSGATALHTPDGRAVTGELRGGRNELHAHDVALERLIESLADAVTALNERLIDGIDVRQPGTDPWRVGGQMVDVASSHFLTTVGGAYVSGDYVGTSAKLFRLPNVARLPGGSGVIYTGLLTDQALQSASLELHLFKAPIVPPADNDAWTITDSEQAFFAGTLSFSTYTASAANSVSTVANAGLGFVCAPGSRDLWGALVTRGTPTFTAAKSELGVRLIVLQD